MNLNSLEQRPRTLPGPWLLLLILLCLAPASILPGPAASQAVATGKVPAEEDPAVTALALKVYGQMRAGHIDPSLLTPEMSAEFSPDTLSQQKPIFDQLGSPTRITFVSGERHTRGTLYAYLVSFAAAEFHVQIFVHKDGRLAGYDVHL